MSRKVLGEACAVALGAACTTAVLLLAAPAGAQSPRILVASVEGAITPVIADHLQEGVRRAEREGYAAFLVELDTPGGLDASMRVIVRAFLGSRVPVVVHVAPSGARAASAGAIIGMSAHVLAMAPGTTIGAATPVDLQAGEVSDKVVNDAAAYAESIAKLRGRNVEFATQAVRSGRAVPAAEAADISVADLLVSGRSELIAQLDGRTVQVAGGATVTLGVMGAALDEHALGLFPRVLQWLADPNLAFLFLSIGTLAVIYELANPGVGGAGIVGVILLVVALFALSVLPVNLVGVLLLVLAGALFVTEVFTPGLGVFAAGGTASLLLAGLFLFRGEVGVDPVVLLPLAIVVGGGTLLAGRVAWRSRRAPQLSGSGAVVGHTGVVRTASGESGQVIVDGIWWNARAPRGSLEAGRTVRVVGMDGLDLIVESAEEESP